jgi:hypothetical protein
VLTDTPNRLEFQPEWQLGGQFGVTTRGRHGADPSAAVHLHFSARGGASCAIPSGKAEVRDSSYGWHGESGRGVPQQPERAGRRSVRASAVFEGAESFKLPQKARFRAFWGQIHCDEVLVTVNQNLLAFGSTGMAFFVNSSPEQSEISPTALNQVFSYVATESPFWGRHGVV